MLSSIHPLGERARHNSWLRTVMAFTFGALVGGALLGVVLGAVGSVLFDSPHYTLAAIAVGLAALADLARVAIPGPRRQVDERWITTYRDWVYGAGFGFQLGLGFTTFLATWGMWALAVSMILSADIGVATVVGIGFGAGRAITVWTSIGVRTRAELVEFGLRVQRLAAPARIATITAMLIVAGGVAWPV